MEGLGTNSAAPLDSSSSIGSSAGSIHQTSQTPPPPPTLPHGLPDHLKGWETIHDQRDFYDERDFLHPSCNLTSQKLRSRKEDGVVIFDYSLSCKDGGPPVEGGGPSSGHSSGHDDIFFQVPKSKLVESRQFNQIINPTKEPRLMQSLGPRLSIM